MRTLWLVAVLSMLALLTGCGGGGGIHDANPWQGRYVGDYEMANDHGDLDVVIDYRGKMEGEWFSRVDGARGPLWGDISHSGRFTFYTSWVTAYGHGEVWEGTRVLIIDGYSTRGPSQPKISNLKKVDEKRASGDLVGS